MNLKSYQARIEYLLGGVNLARRVIHGSSSNSEIQSNNTYFNEKEKQKKRAL